MLCYGHSTYHLWIFERADKCCASYTAYSISLEVERQQDCQNSDCGALPNWSLVCFGLLYPGIWVGWLSSTSDTIISVIRTYYVSRISLIDPTCKLHRFNSMSIDWITNMWYLLREWNRSSYLDCCGSNCGHDMRLSSDLPSTIRQKCKGIVKKLNRDSRRILHQVEADRWTTSRVGRLIKSGNNRGDNNRE